MTNWWRTDDELMTSWWRADDELMTSWWRTDDELMTSWWRTDAKPHYTTLKPISGWTGWLSPEGAIYRAPTVLIKNLYPDPWVKIRFVQYYLLFWGWSLVLVVHPDPWSFAVWTLDPQFLSLILILVLWPRQQLCCGGVLGLEPGGGRGD